MSAECKKIMRPLAKLWPFFACSVLLTALYPLVVRAQNPAPNVQYTNKAVDLGLRGDVTVNPSTRALEIQIPLAGYAGRAGFNVPIDISYSSKVHRIKYEAYNPGQYNSNGQPLGNGYTLVSDRFAEYSSAGWTTSVGFPVQDYSAQGELYDMFGKAVGTDGQCNQQVDPFTPYPCYIIDRMVFRMPDGSTHELRSTDQPRLPNDPTIDDYYSVDGSRMRYQRSTQTLFMGDGSRYVLGTNPKFIDRNGNTITDTDTLGRAIPHPPMAGTGSNGGTSGDYTYSVPGVGGSLNYTLKWRYLDDSGVLTTFQPLQYVADSRCPLGNGSYSPHLFLSDPIGTHTCIVNGDSLFRPVVLYQIVLPTGQAYTFTYNIYGEIDKVVLPTGGYERYEYAQVLPLTTGMVAPYLQGNRGVTRRYVSASGLPADEVLWQYSGGGGSVNITAPDGSLTALSMYTDAPLQSTFGYSLDQPRAGRTSAENFYSPPDGNGAAHLLRRHLSEWSATGSNASSQFSGAQQAARNARLTKEVEIIFDTGGGALAKTTTHDYDLTYQFSTGVNETATNEYDYVVLDQTTAQTIAIGSIPTGTVLRRTEKTYLDATNQAYRDRNLLGLVASVTVKDAAGNMIAQSSINYDEGGQFAQLNDYSNVTNWMDPQTPYRGNATTTSHWLNFNGSTFSTFPNGAYLTSHAQYDQCGSVRKTWDARDTTLTNPSQANYLDAFSDGVPRNTYAFPTSMTTAVPDLNGAYGSNAAFVATSVYDFNTGRAVSTTDANNQTTSYDYSDPLNRIRQVTAPNGARVRYNYSDTPGDLYVQMLTDEDTRSIETRKYFDNFGRAVRGFLYDGTPSTPWSVTDTYYDTMGRVSQVSNPYRTSSPGASVPVTCSVCTTSVYDALGRVTTVTTPDGAHVASAYAASTSGTLGTTVTVTDQASRLRRSLTDAMGRLVRVDEPDKDTGSLDNGSGPVQPTYYSYDVLGNLKRVDQGTQHRYFLYDSLSRLIRARNPELDVATVNNLDDPYVDPVYPNSQWGMAYTYDSNGNLLTKTDARSNVSTYAYDALNRVTIRSYSDGTPAVTYRYDLGSVSNGKGRLGSVSSSVSSYSYSGYDVLGRVLSGTQTTNGVAYPLSYAYNLAGEMTSQTYPSGRVITSEYDNAGRLAGVQNQASGLFYAGGAATDSTNRIQYTAHGAMSVMKLGNGLWEHTNFNSRLQPTQIGLGSASTNSSMLQLDYSYGTTTNNGNVQSQTITVPTIGSAAGFADTQTYGYDSLNRLSSAQENGGSSWTQNFSYDRYGNRNFASGTTLPEQLTPSNNPVINTGNNRLDITVSGQTNVTYDPAGNLTHDINGHAYVYDGENKQTTYDGGASANGGATYYYDGDGRRVKKVVGGSPMTSTVFVYDVQGQLVAEYGDAQPTTTGGTSYLTEDTLGTPRVNTDASGNVRARHDYLPFGEELFAGTGGRTPQQGYTGDSVRQKFTGYERDNETGLDFAETRMYGYSLGRFTSPDNFLNGSHASNPQSWNLYAYVTNNPLSLTDPTGMAPTDFVDRDGNRTHIEDGQDQVLFAEHIDELQSQFNNDRTAYNQSVQLIAASGDNFHMTVAQFNQVAGTIYTEATDNASVDSTTAEAGGIYSVLRNRGSRDNESIVEEASASHGVYGALHADKIFERNASASKRNAVYAGMALSQHTGDDYSGGAYYWQGVDFHITGSNAYRQYYQSGFNFTNSNHDIWGMGDHAVKGVVGRGRDQRTYSYKYESTRAAAHTTFMRLTDEWKRANRYNGAY